MLFRQLTDSASRRFTYLVASRFGGVAVVIDPYASQVELTARLVDALDLRLVCALGTHSSPDVESGLAAAKKRMGCVVAMGAESRLSCVSRFLRDGEVLDLEGVKLEALHTPGYTPDAYSFVMDDRVFTGNTLLIDETGSLELPGCDARLQYDSLFTKLLSLPGRTLVYPIYNAAGRNVTTIAEQRVANPKLQVNSVEEFISNSKATEVATIPVDEGAIRESGVFPAGSAIALPDFTDSLKSGTRRA